MFLENLSANLLRLCENQALSYEAASEKCRLSARHFGSVVRGQASPRIDMLEKLCTGFEVTPNDLLLPADPASYSQPMPVTQVRSYSFDHSRTSYPVCPKCGLTLDREYQGYCDRCGQCLDWSCYENAAVVLSK